MTEYDKQQHLSGCRKVMYDPSSSPCTCRSEYERLVTELELFKREAQAHAATVWREALQIIRETEHLYQHQVDEGGEYAALLATALRLLGNRFSQKLREVPPPPAEEG